MDGREILGALATLIALISYVPYLITIFKGTTRPHGFSWIVFGLLTVIGFAAQVYGGAGAGAWVMGFSAAICFIIAGLAVFKGTFDPTRSDWITFIAALAAIPLWLATDNPLYAVILITLIDALAFYPTFRKAYHYPHEELVFTFFLSGLKFVLSLFALDTVSLVTVVYPASLIFMNWLFIAMVVYRRNVLSKV